MLLLRLLCTAGILAERGRLPSQPPEQLVWESSVSWEPFRPDMELMKSHLQFINLFV